MEPTDPAEDQLDPEDARQDVKQEKANHQAESGDPDAGGKALTNEAFVGLLIANDQRVRGFIASLLLPSSEVDDVFQNTSVAAFRKVDSFRYRADEPDEEFLRWVCTIARYEVLRYYQRARRAKVVFSSELVEELADLQLEMQAELGERQEALFVCVERMPPRQQELIKMRYGAGEAVAEIAARLGITANGVYKSLATVRAALSRCIESQLSSAGVE